MEQGLPPPTGGVVNSQADQLEIEAEQLTSPDSLVSSVAATMKDFPNSHGNNNGSHPENLHLNDNANNSNRLAAAPSRDRSDNQSESESRRTSLFSTSSTVAEGPIRSDSDGAITGAKATVKPSPRRRSTFSGRSTLASQGSNTVASAPASEAGDDSDDTINVVVRVRPLSGSEGKKEKEQPMVQFPGDGALWVDTGVTTKSFTFNVTFEPEATQGDVFEHSGIKKLIEMAMNGYSCTAFAFGQTGSGKTHTITGPPSSLVDNGNRDESQFGLIPRSFHHLFYMMNQSDSVAYRIKASYLEIYNEHVIDLLNPRQPHPLTVRWSKNKGFYVENLFVIECETIDDLTAVLEEGLS